MGYPVLKVKIYCVKIVVFERLNFVYDKLLSIEYVNSNYIIPILPSPSALLSRFYILMTSKFIIKTLYYLSC